jgi:hypothetical protein
MRYVFIFLSILLPGICLADGTHTAAMVQMADTNKNYLNIDKLSTMNVIDNSKEKVCLIITDDLAGTEYKVTEEREIILLLIEIMKDLNAKIKAK